MSREVEGMAARSLDRVIGKEGRSAPSVSIRSLSPFSFAFWRNNPELFLASVTLFALLIGWLGGSISGVLPAWAVVIFALVAYGAGGFSGAKVALENACCGVFNIDLLMVAAALGAALIGEWEEGALLLFLFTLSGALESFASDRTRQAISGLAELRPETARVQREGELVEIDIEELAIGDLVIVRPGERLPVDGSVVRGSTTVDQSPITGESIPVYKSIGDSVFSGTINGSGALELQVTKIASESTISKIIGLVQEAQNNAAPTQRVIDRFSQPYTLVVIAATFLAAIVPILIGNEPVSTTIYRAITLLVVASPCALIISTPASILSAIAAAAREGILFKGGAYLEAAASLDMLAFDKTGTLTSGKPQLTDVVPLNGYTEKELLSIAAGAESLSEHPIAQAIVDRAQALELSFESPQDFRGVAGHGVQAIYERGGTREIVYIGNDKLFMSESIDLSPAIRMVGQQLQRKGKTAILVVRGPIGTDGVYLDTSRWSGVTQNDEQTLRHTERDWEAVGFFAVADTVRPGAAETIEALKRLGIERMVMVTGDNRDVASAVADEIGMENVYSELLPEEKVEIVDRLVKTGSVGMVGDGVNDAPAMATSNLGIAMGGAGTDVALETADVVLMSDDLSMLPFMLRLSRRASEIVQQNLYFSVAVILTLVTFTIVVPLLIPGFRLPLPVGVLGHEGSTLIVVVNGLRMLTMKSDQ
ncbi:MAG: heavy metal translocating P-type ATPase [Caldilineaceae bacterium]|nr:heavy metal translocating P-type ATPase [Caldilineaceae bacterium]